MSYEKEGGEKALEALTGLPSCLKTVTWPR